MNDKVKAGVENIDKTAEKCNSIINGFFDKYLELLKAKDDAILGGVEYVASRFGVFAMIVCGLLYTILCLKNMFFSIFFKDSPVKMCFVLAIGSLIALAICVYAATKMMDALSKVISSSVCKISSLNIFSVMTAIGLLLTVASLLGGIYFAIEFETVQLFLYGLGGAVFFALITLYTANPEKFGIVADETASAGEDFVSISTFGLKVMLRLVPVALLVLSVIGIIQIIPMLFTSYIRSGENANHLMTMNMLADMTTSMVFVFIGLMPLVVYLIYISYYVALDLIRAILQLPGKLDGLKK